jgi:hypothetical protein
MQLNGLLPFISVVVAARNDNRGGNTLGRLRNFLAAWVGQATRFHLPSEIIIVEWNPPMDHPTLMESLEWPNDPNPCQIRFIQVPREIHQRYPNPHAVPLHQMLAKNAGIRRSRGEFVLATNIDSVLSPELMQFLAERRLERQTLYRIDRHSVSGEIPSAATADELLTFCQDHIVRLLSAEGTFQVAGDGLMALHEKDIVAPQEGVRFGAGWYPPEYSGEERFRWIRSEAELAFRRPPGLEPGLLIDAETGPSAGESGLPIEVLDSAGSMLASTILKGRGKLRLTIPAQISCGSLRFRVRGSSIPLALEPRFLQLRIFGLRWESSPWWPQPSNSQIANADLDAGIRVRSKDPRQIQLTLHSGNRASLDNLAVRLADRKGNILFQVASDHLQADPGADYVLSLDAGFKFVSQDGEVEYMPRTAAPEWCLEVIATGLTENSMAMNHAPNPFAAQMRAPAYLHTNACDDFMLLSRQDWFALRGFAEFPILPKLVDTLFCYSAHHAGIRERVLHEPMRAFHIEHPSGVGRAHEDDEEHRVSTSQHWDLANWIDRMRRFNAPAIFTLSNWGLGGEELPENLVYRAVVHPGDSGL